MNRKKNQYLWRRTLSGVTGGVVLGGLLLSHGSLPVSVEDGGGLSSGLFTELVAQAATPTVKQSGDRVVKSSHGLQLVSGQVKRDVERSNKHTGDLTLEFKIVDGVKNNSTVSVGIRMQTKGMKDMSYGQSERMSRLGTLGTDLIVSDGTSVGEFRSGRFYFNDQVETYIGSTIRLDLKGVGLRQLITPDPEVKSLNDTLYWDVVVGTNLGSSRDIIGVLEERGNFWDTFNFDNVGSQGQYTLVERNGIPYLDFGIIPGTTSEVKKLVEKSNAPLTFRINYKEEVFGDAENPSGLYLSTYNRNVKPDGVRHAEGFVYDTTPILKEGGQSRVYFPLKKIDDGIYEFTIDDPLKYGFGTDLARISVISIPIKDIGEVINLDTMRLNHGPTFRILQNGREVGGTGGSNPNTGFVGYSVREFISSGSGSLTAESTYKEEKETEDLPYETIRRNNSDLPAGEEKVIQQGAMGVRTRTYSVLYINGRPTATKRLVSDEVTKKPVDRIIEVGAGVVSESVDVKVVEVPYETERVENANLPAGEEKVVQKGIVGSKTITTTTPTMNGKPTGDPKVTEKITKEPVNEVIEVGVGTVDQTVDVKTESIPYETETVHDINLPEGERVVDQVGVPGELTITTTTPTLNGQPNGQPTVTEDVTKQPVKEIIRVGSGVVSEDVKVDTADIPFNTEYYDNRELPKGEEREVQAGQLGTLTITTITPTLNGQPNGQPTVTEEVTKEPISQIIEVGIGIVGEHIDQETLDIPFETERVPNPDLPQGEEQVIQEGVYGSLLITTTTPTLNDLPSGDSVITETVTKDPVTQIIEVGTGMVGEDIQVETINIEYEVEFIEDGTMPLGHEVVEVKGEVGERTIATVTPTLNDEVFGESVITEEITKEPITEVIRVGTGAVDEEVIEEVFELSYETEYRQNPDLPEGEERVVQEGVLGEKVFIRRRPTLNGLPNGPIKVEEKVTKEPIHQIIEVGAGQLSETMTEEQTDIPFETEYRESPNLLEGEERVEQVGVPGKKVITTTITTLNDQPIGEPIIKEEITQEPVNEIIEVGIGQASKDTQEEVVEIPFETEIIYDKELPEGEEVVEQVGEKGELTITTTTSTLNGQSIEEPTITEKVTKDPVNEIIRVGMGVPSEEVSVEQVDIPFDTQEINDPNLPEGERRIEQHGVTGILTITTKTPTLNGQLMGEPTITEEITKEPRDEIIRVGTGSTQTQTPQPPQSGDTPNKPDVKPASTPEPDQKPDVKTGVEAITTNPTLLTTLGTALTGLFTAFGFRYRRRKK